MPDIKQKQKLQLRILIKKIVYSERIKRSCS